MFSVCALSNGFLTLSHFETNESTVTNNNIRSTKQSQDPYWQTKSPETEDVNFHWDFINIHLEKENKNPPFGSFKKVSCFSSVISTGEWLRHWWAQQQKNVELGNVLVVARPPEVHSWKWPGSVLVTDLSSGEILWAETKLLLYKKKMDPSDFWFTGATNIWLLRIIQAICKSSLSEDALLLRTWRN